MFYSDSRADIPMDSNSIDNIDSITINVVCEIEKELLNSPYDTISLVFLLYDIPDTALQRLIVYERISKDVYSTNLNLLHQWVQVAKSKPNWRHEFLEALVICQLYGIIRKMGFNIQNVIKHYQPDNNCKAMYINPTKKCLYKLCENINSNNLKSLKTTLLQYDIDTMEYESCELVFLKLMSERIIPTTGFQLHDKSRDFNFDKLVILIQKLPGLEIFAYDLRNIQKKSSNESAEAPVAASSPNVVQSTSASTSVNKQRANFDFSETFDLLCNLNIDDEEDIKSDSKTLAKFNYTIKDPNRLGLCLIINQESFYFCNESLCDETLTTSLDTREGSTKDKIELEKTMSSMNFKVITADNLNHTDMLNFIRKNIKEKVLNTDSVFMLCIMSHGVVDHVFAADSVKVNVDDIQNIMDSEQSLKLRGIPKVLIIQACQVDDFPQSKLVADSPISKYLPNSDFLVFWATSPKYKAYRLEEMGSIFIQLLCRCIQKRGKTEHLYDIFTKVNYGVTNYCTRVKRNQVPLFKSTLRKRLYLYAPK